MIDIYFWRQFFILLADILTSWGIGVMLAFPSVLNPAITAANTTDIRTTKDHASWIASFNGVGGLVGSFLMAPILQILGRRACHITLNFFYLIGFLIFPLATNIYALYAARFIQGISTGGIYIKGFIISEYVHPHRRGYFITLQKVATAFGVLCCHAMSAFWTWRQVAIFAAVPLFIAMIMTYFWPESPSHLAFKGKFAECENSFIWLNGNTDESHKQLQSLMIAQREKIQRNRKNKNSFVKLLKTFLKKDFQKPFLVTSVLTLAVDVCGRYYYMAYIIQIMTELTDSKASGIYFTLGADLLTVLAISTSTMIIRYVNRRTILFTSGIMSVLLMFVIGVMVYLKTIYTFSTAVLWFIALLIILQSFIVNIGIVPVAFALISEIFPLEHKGLGSFTSCFIFTSLYAVTMKLSSMLMESIKLYGTYGIFSIVLAVCLRVLYNTVPETKDKTLQQIEDELNDVPDREIVFKEREKLVQI